MPVSIDESPAKRRPDGEREAQQHGSRPDAPRNVKIRKVGNRWKLSWDPPSDFGGWLITRYRYGDTGPRLHQGAPGRACRDSSWPMAQFYPDDPPPAATSGDDGRMYGLLVPVHLPKSSWTLSISAVNARGEGSCTAGSR